MLEQPMTEDQMRTEDYLQLSSVYALLSRLWEREVDLELLQGLNEADLKEAYEAMGGYVPDANEEMVETLAVDYCQLLIGPKNQISPVQSVWEEDKFQGKAAVSMNKYFEALPSFPPPANVVDHIGVQLGYMAELFVQASAADNPEALEEIATHFIADHFAWTGPFLQQIESRAQTDFYQGLANMSREFLAFEFEEAETEES